MLSSVHVVNTQPACVVGVQKTSAAVDAPGFLQENLFPKKVSASVQAMTVREALETGSFFRSCSENALGDRMVCELLQDELEALKSESVVVIVL